jgi:hypothetical protein
MDLGPRAGIGHAPDPPQFQKNETKKFGKK